MLSSFRHTHLNPQEREIYQRLARELDVPAVSAAAPEVLVDISDTMCECIEQLAFARYFAERYGLRPTTYVPGFTQKRRAIHRLLKGRTNFVISRGYRLARAHGMDHGFDAGIVDSEVLSLAQRDAHQFFALAHTKEQMLGYREECIPIGVAIYDTYLRETMEATVRRESKRFRTIVLEAFTILRAVEKYFRSHRVGAVVLGHCVYNNWKILSDYARTRGAQVFVTYNSRTVPLHDVNANRGLQTTDHSTYKQRFSTLPPEEQDRARAAGAALLERRLAGELDPGLAYMTCSPYAGNPDHVPVEIAAGKRPVVIMLHSFFDSPHIYEHMVFPDFLEWLRSTLELCGTASFRSRYEILVKPHPNRFPLEDDLIAKVLAEHPFAKLLPPSTSNAAVVKMCPACVLTVYGSVAAEFSFRGIPVITCGDNPTSSFSFTFEARSRQEYAELLENAGSLAVDSEQHRQIGEFVFMHYLQDPQPSVAYPFERFTPHCTKAGHERIGTFQYESFRQLVDAKMALLDCGDRLNAAGHCTLVNGDKAGVA